MTHNLDKISYMNGAPVQRQYEFPYDECYLGTRLEIECLHEWKQKQIEKFETFRRMVHGIEAPLSASGKREIVCDITKHMVFFMEQRINIKDKFAEHGIHCETTSANISDHNGDKCQVETISVAGHWRLWAKLKK